LLRTCWVQRCGPMEGNERQTSDFKPKTASTCGYERLRESVLVNTLFENKVEQLYDVTVRVASALESAGISYQIIGGFAVFSHVEAVDPLGARLTRDVDITVDREQLKEIAAAVEPAGFRYPHVAGVDMLVDAKEPKARSAVHLVFANEKVRSEYIDSVPGISAPVRSPRGYWIAPVGDLVRMKLTSFRLKDQVHIQDLDSAHLITPEIEAALGSVLRARLAEVRASR